MNRIIILTILLSFSNASVMSWWTKSPIIKKYCKDSVRDNGKYKILSYPLSSYTQSSIVITHRKDGAKLTKLSKMSGQLQWQKTLAIKPVAITHNNKYIFVLTSHELYQHSAENGDLIQKISFYSHSNIDKYARAQDLEINDETLYVSLGSGGVNTYFFDDKSIIYVEKFSANVNPDNNHRSYVSGLSLSPDKKQLLVAIDNITLGHDKKAFEGFLIIDSEYLNIIETLPLKNNREVLGMPLVHWNFDNSFLVNNLNIFMGFSTKKKPRRRNVSPNKRFLKYSNGGRPLGRILVEKSEIRYCELVGGAHKKHAIPAIMTYEP